MNEICEARGKVRYENRAIALHGLRALSGKSRKARRHSGNVVYHCRACGGWHLGRQRQASKSKPTQKG